MRQVRIFQLCLAATIFAGVFVFQGCGNQEEKESATSEENNLSTASIHRGGTYRFPLMNSPSTLDPAYVRDKYGETLIHQLYDGLVRFDPYLAVTPALAETWKVTPGFTMGSRLLPRMWFSPSADFCDWILPRPLFPIY